MSTEISSLGKQAAIAKLFENSGFCNESPFRLKERGQVCTSHKVMLEGVDFDLVYTPLKHLGYKAALYTIGDIYAAFHTPVSLSVNLSLSKRFSFEDVASLWEGIVSACKEHSITHVSLDLTPSVNGLCISMASCGVQKKSVLDKMTPEKSMDLICLTGHVGAAYMGLHILEREKISFTGTNKQPDLSQYKAVLASFLSPEVKPDTISRFIEADIFPSRGYFLTQGLGSAIKRLVRDSSLGAKVYIERIPISSQTFAVAEELDIDPVTAAMNGGDDYKFIFTLPLEKHEIIRKDFQDYDIIGHLAKPDVGAVLVTPEGAELEIKAQGF